MWITHRFIGITKDDTDYLFFLLLEDYIDEQTQFYKELSLELERFARNLGERGALVKPFTGDIEEARKSVLEKGWSPDQEEEIKKTPAILLINTDFNEFDPRDHQWAVLNFGNRLYEGIPGVYKFRDILIELAKIISKEDGNPFRFIENIHKEIKAENALKVFEAKPNIFGFSIDLVKAGELLLEKIKE